MHLMGKRKQCDKKQADDESEAGPSQRKTLAISAREDTDETVSDATTSLEKGINDPMFGHYWIRFVNEVKNQTSKSTQQSEEILPNVIETPLDEETAGSCELFCGLQASGNLPVLSSSYVEQFFEDVERTAESDAGSSLKPSSAESEFQMVEERSVECESESTTARRQINEQRFVGADFPVSFEETFTTKEPITKYFNVQTENTNNQILTPYNETTKDLTRDCEQVHFGSKLFPRKKENTNLSKSEKKSFKSLHCGTCKLTFGQSDVLNNLLYKFLREEDIDIQEFKCHVCSITIKAIYCIQKHIVRHLTNNDVYCMKCQKNFIFGQVMYDLETEGTSTQITPFVETQELAERTKLKRLTRSQVKMLSKLSPRCRKCGDEFGNVVNKFLRMYQYRSPILSQKRITSIYCCILCGACTPVKRNQERHMMRHFNSDLVNCRKCYYERLPSRNIPKISTKYEAAIWKAPTIENLKKDLKINCKNCQEFLAESAVLKPQSLRTYKLFIEDGRLNILSDVVFRCVICHSKYSMSEIAGHVAEHVTSNLICCKECFNKDSRCIACIETLSFPLVRSKVKIPCLKCNECFSDEDVHSKYKSFSLRSSPKERNFTETHIFLCNFCKETYSTKVWVIDHIRDHVSRRDLFCSLCTNKGMKK